MKDSKELYRIRDEEARLRAQEFGQTENPTSRHSEIAQARVLLEQAINAGQTSSAVAILNSIDRLAKGQFRQDLAEHRLVTRPALFKFAGKMVEIFSEEIKVLDGFEDVLLRVSDRIDEALAELKNDAKDVEGLALPR